MDKVEVMAYTVISFIEFQNVILTPPSAMQTYTEDIKHKACINKRQ